MLFLSTVAPPSYANPGEKRQTNDIHIKPFPVSSEILQKKNIEYASRSLFACKPRDQIRESDKQMPIDANHRINQALYSN